MDSTLQPPESVRDAWLADKDPRLAPLIVALDQAVRAASPDLTPAIRYKILMYGLKGDYRAWVCALDVTKKGACLRFLYGAMLRDERRLLRPGSSTLSSIDFPTLDAIDPAVVDAYVREAVAGHAAFAARALENKKKAP